MRKGYSQNGVFVDTGLLRDHVSKLRKEKKTASKLYEKVAFMKSVSDPTTSYKYNPILRDIEQLIKYFDRMADLLDYADDEAIHLSNELGAIIEDDAERTRHISLENFML